MAINEILERRKREAKAFNKAKAERKKAEAALQAASDDGPRPITNGDD